MRGREITFEGITYYIGPSMKPWKRPWIAKVKDNTISPVAYFRSEKDCKDFTNWLDGIFNNSYLWSRRNN